MCPLLISMWRTHGGRTNPGISVPAATSRLIMSRRLRDGGKIHRRQDVIFDQLFDRTQHHSTMYGIARIELCQSVADFTSYQNTHC